MAEENDVQEVIETPESEEETVETPDDTVTLTAQEAQELRDKAAKVEDLEDKNKKLFARLKEKPVEKPSKKDDLSSKDLYALMQAQVPEDDVEEVQRIAKGLGLTVAEALKDTVTKTILERRQDLRKTAEAMNTKSARPSNKKITDEEIVKKTNDGEVPDKGSTDAEQLFWARRGGKK